MSICELVNMGHYNIYVWPAYGITLLVFTIIILTTLREKSQTKNRITRYLKRQKEKS